MSKVTNGSNGVQDNGGGIKRAGSPTLERHQSVVSGELYNTILIIVYIIDANGE